MADAIYGALAPAHKPPCGAAPRPPCDPLSRSAPPGPAPAPRDAHPGLVAHPLLTPDLQVTLLAAVDEGADATLGDLVALLPRHPAPAGAVLALVEAGLLACERDTPFDAHLRLWRASALAPKERLKRTSESHRRGDQAVAC